MYWGKSKTLNFSEHFKMQTCKSVRYFLSYSGFKSRPSFSITLYKNAVIALSSKADRANGHVGAPGINHKEERAADRNLNAL